MDAAEETTVEDSESVRTVGVGYSRKNPAGIGIPLDATIGSTGFYPSFGDTYQVRISMLESIRGNLAWDMVYAANQFNDQPDEDHEYILAKIKFEYLSGPTDDTKYSLSPVWFDCLSLLA
jgi:hypothetical protein